MSDIKADWITCKKAATLLGVNVRFVPGIAWAGRIRVKKIPGFPRASYCREDVERVIRESIGVGAAPVTNPAPPAPPAPPLDPTARRQATRRPPVSGQRMVPTPAPAPRPRTAGSASASAPARRTAPKKNASRKQQALGR